MPEPNQDLEAYLDPEIEGEERDFMLALLAALPEEAREDVVHVNDDGTIYTNRIANKGNITILHKDKTGTWLDQNGDSYPLALPSQSHQPLAEEPVEEIEEPVYPAPAITIEPLAAVTPRCELDGTGIEFRVQSKPSGTPSLPRYIHFWCTDLKRAACPA